MSAVDRVIRALAPKWALNREVARLRLEHIDRTRQIEQTSYSAADRSRLNRDWMAKATSADLAIVPDMPLTNARARLGARNDWLIRSIIDTYRRHIVGRGIIAKSDARDTQKQPLAEFNDAIDRMFNDEWGVTPAACDIEQRKSFVEIQGLLAEEFIESGQAMVIWSYVPNDEHVGLRLQVIETEQLDTDMVMTREGFEVRNGIEIGRYGEPRAYWIHTQEHPHDTYRRSEATRIPADRVLHFMRQGRVRQTHSLSLLAPVLEKARNLQMYDQYMLARARLEACIGAVITNSDAAAAAPYELGLGPADGSNTTSDTSGGDDFEWTFEPGMNPELPPGKDVKFNTPTTPGGTYEPYVMSQLHAIAAGAGLDFASVVKDYRQGSFITLRMGTLERDRMIEPLQRLLIDQVLRPIRALFVTLAVMEGRVDAPDFLTDAETRKRYQRHHWYPPPRPAIDPAKEMAANKIAIEQRLITRQAIIARQYGEDWRDTFHQIRDEQTEAGPDRTDIRLPETASQQSGASGDHPPVDPSEPRPNRNGALTHHRLNGVL